MKSNEQKPLSNKSTLPLKDHKEEKEFKFHNVIEHVENKEWEVLKAHSHEIDWQELIKKKGNDYFIKNLPEWISQGLASKALIKAALPMLSSDWIKQNGMLLWKQLMERSSKGASYHETTQDIHLLMQLGIKPDNTIYPWLKKNPAFVQLISKYNINVPGELNDPLLNPKGLSEDEQKQWLDNAVVTGNVEGVYTFLSRSESGEKLGALQEEKILTIDNREEYGRERVQFGRLLYEASQQIPSDVIQTQMKQALEHFGLVDLKAETKKAMADSQSVHTSKSADRYWQDYELIKETSEKLEKDSKSEQKNNWQEIFTKHTNEQLKTAEENREKFAKSTQSLREKLTTLCESKEFKALLKENLNPDPKSTFLVPNPFLHPAGLLTLLDPKNKENYHGTKFKDCLKDPKSFETVLAMVRKTGAGEDKAVLETENYYQHNLDCYRYRQTQVLLHNWKHQIGTDLTYHAKVDRKVNLPAMLQQVATLFLNESEINLALASQIKSIQSKPDDPKLSKEANVKQREVNIKALKTQELVLRKKNLYSVLVDMGTSYNPASIIYPAYVPELKSLILMSVKEVNLAHLRKISKDNHNNPILIKQGDKIFLYGFSELEWKITDLDKKLFESIKFPAVDNTTSILEARDITQAMRDEIISKKAHNPIEQISCGNGQFEQMVTQCTTPGAVPSIFKVETISREQAQDYLGPEILNTVLKEALAPYPPNEQLRILSSLCQEKSDYLPAELIREKLQAKLFPVFVGVLTKDHLKQTLTHLTAPLWLGEKGIKEESVPEVCRPWFQRYKAIKTLDFIIAEESNEEQSPIDKLCKVYEALDALPTEKRARVWEMVLNGKIETPPAFSKPDIQLTKLNEEIQQISMITMLGVLPEKKRAERDAKISKQYEELVQANNLIPIKGNTIEDKLAIYKQIKNAIQMPLVEKKSKILEEIESVEKTLKTAKDNDKKDIEAKLKVLNTTLNAVESELKTLKTLLEQYVQIFKEYMLPINKANKEIIKKAKDSYIEENQKTFIKFAEALETAINTSAQKNIEPSISDLKEVTKYTKNSSEWNSAKISCAYLTKTPEGLAEVLKTNPQAITHLDLLDDLVQKSVNQKQTDMLIGLIHAFPNMDNDSTFNKVILTLWAVKNNQLSVCQALLDAGANPNIKIDNQPAVVWALEKGYSDVCKLLIEKGADLKTQKVVANRNPWINVREIKYSLLDVAISKSNLDIVQCLVKKGMDVNDEKLHHEPPLLQALKDQKNYEIAKFLINNGANVNVKSRFDSPLLLVSALGNVELAKLLIDKKAVLDPLKGQRDTTPLHMAVGRGHKDLVQFYINQGADIHAKHHQGVSVLHIAVHERNLEMIKLLVKNKADLNVLDDDKKTPLHLASEYKGPDQVAIVSYLIENGADVNAVNEQKETPLHWAIKANDEVMIELLIKKGSQLEVKDKDGNTPLQLAIKNGDLSTTRMLIAKQANRNVVDKDKNTLLHSAVEFGCEDIVSLLLEQQLDINAKNGMGKTPLDMAIEDKNEALINMLNKMNAEVKIDSDALFNAIEQGEIATVKKLINRNIDVHQTNSIGEDALRVSLYHPKANAEMVKLLIDAKAEITETHLTTAFRQSQNDRFKILLEHTNLNTVFSENKTCLHLAVQCNAINVIRELLKNKQIDINAKDNEGNTPFHYAVKTGNKELIELFLQDKRCDLNQLNNNKQPPLYFANKKPDSGVLSLLLNHDKIKVDNDLLNFLSREKNHGVALLHFAAKNQKLELFNSVIKTGVDVNAKDGQDKTAMHHAATPLHAAAINSNVVMVKTLIENKASVNERDRDGYTPLHLAAMHANDDLINHLIKNKADLNAQDKFGLTPLHWALKSGNVGAVKILLEQPGINLDVQDKKGKSLKELIMANPYLQGNAELKKSPGWGKFFPTAPAAQQAQLNQPQAAGDQVVTPRTPPQSKGQK